MAVDLRDYDQVGSDIGGQVPRLLDQTLSNVYTEITLLSQILSKEPAQSWLEIR